MVLIASARVSLRNHPMSFLFLHSEKHGGGRVVLRTSPPKQELPLPLSQGQMRPPEEC